MTTATKTPINQTWSVAKIQEKAVEAMSSKMMTTFAVVEKLGPQAMQAFHKAMTEEKVTHLKKEGAKTPIDAVRLLAEFEVNVFGSKITVWGDEKQASMEYEYCACWNAMQKACPNMDEKAKEQMGKCWAESLNEMAKGLGFSKGEVTFPTEQRAVVTFTK